MAKIEEALQTHGSVEAHHLGDLSTGDLQTIIQQMKAIDYDSYSTLSLFTSPHYLTKDPRIISALLDCHARQTLQLVAIDKVHPYAQHGRSFREAMRILTTLFFAVVFLAPFICAIDQC